MPLEGLDGTFSFVGPFLERCDELPFDLVVVKVGSEGGRAFIIEYLKLGMVSMCTKEVVSLCVGML